MKIMRFFFICLIPFYISGQNWEQVNSFPFPGVHHPITFSYEQYAFVITGSNTDNV